MKAYWYGKRVVDLSIATLGLLLIGPLLLVIALLVWQSLGWPIFFVQPRPGLRGRIFNLIKFRTMTAGCDVSGNLLPDGARLTRFGRFLRASSLDELPELINVLKGDLSLVGPRPLLVRYLDRYTPRQARRHTVRPGLTGCAQVNGRNALSWEEKFEYDLWYVDHYSFGVDLKILLLTVWHVLTRDGIAAKDSETMPEFMGTPASPNHRTDLSEPGKREAMTAYSRSCERT